MAYAPNVLDQLAKLIDSVSRFPERDSYPKEVIAPGIREYRHTAFKPSRVAYRVVDDQVIPYLIADERRDMQKLPGSSSAVDERGQCNDACAIRCD